MVEPRRQKLSLDLSSGGHRPSGPLVDLLYAVQPKAEGLFRQYEIDVSDAEDILTTAIQVLVWKWETVRNREAWLLAVLERKCSLLVGDEAGENENV